MTGYALSLPNKGSGTYTLITPTVNPFGVSGGVAQNVDAQIYFSASTYTPATILFPQGAYIEASDGTWEYALPPKPVGSQYLIGTYDWTIQINLDGTIGFSVPLFFAPVTAAQNAYLKNFMATTDFIANPNIAYPCTIYVTSTVPLPTTNLSPEGVYLRVYVNCYGGSESYPGASTVPCVVFFTSSDAGQTFEQFGAAVPLPSRTDPSNPMSGPSIPIEQYGATRLPQGNYMPLSGAADQGSFNVYIGANIDGGNLEVLPGMQFYKCSLQDSGDRYLLNYDFTQQNSSTLLDPAFVAFNGAAVVSV